MKKSFKYIIFSFYFLIIFHTSYCQNNFIHKVHTIDLHINDSLIYSINVVASQIIIGDSAIQLYPNDKFFIEGKIKNEKLMNLNTVDKNINPNKTLEIEFKQITDNNIHKQMILSIKNPFSKILYFRCQIYLVKQKKWIDTDVFPVKPGLVNFETWPDLISSIVLSDFFFTKDEN